MLITTTNSGFILWLYEFHVVGVKLSPPSNELTEGLCWHPSILFTVRWAGKIKSRWTINAGERRENDVSILQTGVQVLRLL